MTIKCVAILQHSLENDLQYSIVNLKDYKHTHVIKATINNAKWKSSPAALRVKGHPGKNRSQKFVANDGGDTHNVSHSQCVS